MGLTGVCLVDRFSEELQLFLRERSLQFVYFYVLHQVLISFWVFLGVLSLSLLLSFVVTLWLFVSVYREQISGLSEAC